MADRLIFYEYWTTHFHQKLPPLSQGSHISAQKSTKAMDKRGGFRGDGWVLTKMATLSNWVYVDVHCLNHWFLSSTCLLDCHSEGAISVLLQEWKMFNFGVWFGKAGKKIEWVLEIRRHNLQPLISIPWIKFIILYVSCLWIIGHKFTFNSEMHPQQKFSENATWRWCEPTCLCLEPLFDIEPIWPLTLTHVIFDLDSRDLYT